MKAAVLKAARTMVCEEIPTPVPGDGEVLVRVLYCGVCGSDIPRYVDGAVHSFPLVLGHEFSGIVEGGCGDAAEALIGKRVAGVPLIPCMECPDCAAGNYSLCKHYSFIGSRQQGAYAQYVCVPVQNVLALPDGVGDMEAAFFEPAAVAEHAIALIDPIPGRTAVVAGCGTVGIFTAQILQDLGLDVVALARRDIRIKAAIDAGVKTVFDTSQEDWEQRLLEAYGEFDYVFDTSGNNSMMVTSLSLAANKGHVCMIGTPKRPMQLEVREWENINRKELTIIGSWMSYSAPWPGVEWDNVAERFARRVLAVSDSMIDSINTLEEIPCSMQKFTTPNSVTGKMLIQAN